MSLFIYPFNIFIAMQHRIDNPSNEPDGQDSNELAPPIPEEEKRSYGY